ncbi:ABC transporter ATP-binding protein [Limimaricola hongkongensis]|uniref:Various polyols ABC transporter, ATP-binding component n=1 Tax=Limimaricola hongkongensis DSM 17492 TaxID=1122180 RepID=A0A017HEM7_9RHOB|nr:ABC transporter ATP-binding protein [Limimaricola hongkongensis]EYD72563.1 Various polyols ABC transporter, ATP-binding component [Limimaricola hongkongensis DSM 17492]
MASIELKGVEKWFGEVQVIKGVDLAIEEGEFVIFVGPSGCGKSTLLRMIAGLEGTSRGQIMVGGRDATAEPPSKRGLAMVFQSYALYPHMSVAENMGFSLKAAGVKPDERARQVAEAARVLRLEEYLDRRPRDLSGGQRQRVAIGRSIVRDPTAFLFDEPLSNLDAALRVEMRYEIAKLHQTLKSTMIYVTHDQIEAMTLADRIVVLEAGRIAQVGTPKELYEHPANLFVAQFIGSPKMNVMPCRTAGGEWRIEGGRGGAYPGARDAVTLGIRPEHIALLPEGEGACDGTVDLLEYLGADTYVIVDCGGEVGRITLRVIGGTDLRPGQRVGLGFDAERLHFFDAEGQAAR